MRKTGFYWIKYKSSWEIAKCTQKPDNSEYIKSDGCWEMVGIRGVIWGDSNFAEINEKQIIRDGK